jgi:3-hydroxyacyl-CoA dehydrogenase
MLLIVVPLLQSGMSRIRSNLASRVKKGRMSQAAADAAMAKVTGTLDYNAFGEHKHVSLLSCVLCFK